jgi:hypothetical protein
MDFAWDTPGRYLFTGAPGVNPQPRRRMRTHAYASKRPEQGPTTGAKTALTRANSPADGHLARSDRCDRRYRKETHQPFVTNLLRGPIRG